MLPDEEVAVVEGGCIEADEELAWAWGGKGNVFELEAWVSVNWRGLCGFS